jgi:CRP/FNR family transcriptional activator FtrB
MTLNAADQHGAPIRRGSAGPAPAGADPSTLRPDDRRLVEASAFFAALPAERRAALLGAATLRRWPAKAPIMLEGEHPGRMCVVVEGLVQLCTMYEDRESTVVVLTPGTAFAVSAILRGEPMIASARTLRPSTVVDIPAAEVRAQLAAADPFAMLLLQDLAISYRNALREIKTMRLPNKTERLVSWILTMHRTAGPSGEIQLPFGKQVLAARLGIEPATLSRMFARLAGHGVEVAGRTVRVRDIEALRRFSAREPLSEPSVP